MGKSIKNKESSTPRVLASPKRQIKGDIQKYNPGFVEPKWQKVWLDNKTYQPNLENAKKPFYNLMMFPHPSAEGLHVGNMYAFTGADVYGRFKRMLGNDVFEPIGLDGFGIHSENYAMKVGRTPQEHAKISQENFYRQMHNIGSGFAWDNKLETYDPAYYKWTQWIFIQLFKAGLAYRKKAAVNFCPSCKTVLADEQVIDGKCERCGTVVEKKELEQWFFKITKYADRLLHNLDTLDWTEKVKLAQKNWIGKKDGMRIKHTVKDLDVEFETFTAYPAWSFADTFIVFAPEHPLIEQLVKGTKHEKEVKEFIEETKRISHLQRVEDKFEKKGVFTGRYAIDPFSGEEMPIWLANFALMDFGTGIIRCSAHDPRDYEFAKKYSIPLRQIVKSSTDEPVNAHTNKGVLMHSGPFTGRKVEEVLHEMIDWIEKKGIGKKVSTYHLRDWLISRQRYWGPPIPMVYCKSCAEKGISWFSLVGSEPHPNPLLTGEGNQKQEMAGWFPVEDKDLPVVLPELENWKPIGVGASPLALAKDWVAVKCPQCHEMARRETDVTDVFLDSAWYFLRYLASDNSKIPFPSKEFEIRNLKLEIGNSIKLARWLPVNMYIGGAEHSVLHLLYARFVTMVLKDLSLIDFEEPFTRFYAHGLIIKDGAKMSKSKGNVVVPDEYIAKYGADALRTYLMFLGPFNQGGNFSDSAMEGMYKFLKRVWTMAENVLDGCENCENKKLSPEAVMMMHKTIKKVTEEIQHLRYNTAIASLMEYYNFLSTQEQASCEEIEVYIKLLAPFAPHMTEELWHMARGAWGGDYGNEKSTSNVLPPTSFSIHLQQWPEFDEKYLVEDEVLIVVQINGKMRESIRIKKNEAGSKDTVEQMALESDKIKKHLEAKEIKKSIYIEGKVLNFVVN